MYSNKHLLQISLLTLALSGGTSVFAKDCPQTPEAPQIVDGATATMDTLVQNSEAVKIFISDADAYLDCRDSYQKSKAFKKMESAEQEAYRAASKAVLEQRNNIGDSFNEQVAAYKNANR